MRRLHLAPLTAVAAVLVLGCGQGSAPAKGGTQDGAAAGSATTAAAQAQASAPAEKGDMEKLMTFELRIQQYADRIALAADRGESMGIVYNSMNAIGTCLKGGAKELELLKPEPAVDKAKLATIEQHHAAAQAAYEKLGAELKKDPISRAGVLRGAYALSDAAVLAQGGTPKKHPVIKTEEPSKAAS